MNVEQKRVHLFLQIFILQAKFKENVHSEELEIAKYFTVGTILILTGGNVYP